MFNKKRISSRIIKGKLKGYPYVILRQWEKRVQKDLRNDNGKTKKEKKWAYRRGFLSSSIDKYNLNDTNYRDYISDFEYLFVQPINNAYEKWLTDRMTPYYLLRSFHNVMPEIFFNIIKRDGQTKIISIKDNKVKSCVYFLEQIRENGPFVLTPSQTNNKRDSYLLEYRNDAYYINDELIVESEIVRFVNELNRYYIVREYVNSQEDLKAYFNDNEVTFKFILTNETEDTSKILSCSIQTDRPFLYGVDIKKRRAEFDVADIYVDIVNGSFNIDGSMVIVPNWNEICNVIKSVSLQISEIEYLSLYVKLTDDGIKICDYGRKPDIPNYTKVNDELYNYIKEKVINKTIKTKQRKSNLKSHIKWKILRILKKHSFRKGFRDYMFALWIKLVIDDFLNTKDVPFRKKIWAWRRGFPSYRIQQYGLNEYNCSDILSDYNYAWLNRINNTYQKWINDKTTMRYILNPVKEYLPEYYFFVGKRNDRLFIKKLQDCPNQMSSNVDSIIELLKRKKKLVFKPNAGTHGDGFYKLEYRNNSIIANDEVISEKNFYDLISKQKSTYVITEYIEMHTQLKKIYPESVNTIRVMVLNEHCDLPHIVQTYMRVGTSKTGLTDNIAYGGLAVYVDMESGYYDKAALLIDHKYVPTDVHPDTNIKLEGYLPNWNLVKKGVIEVATLMPQLEYLGFDIAIVENGFKILEINIHQDIHKAHEFTEEINSFFRKKINQKNERVKNG